MIDGSGRGEPLSGRDEALIELVATRVERAEELIAYLISKHRDLDVGSSAVSVALFRLAFSTMETAIVIAERKTGPIGAKATRKFIEHQIVALAERMPGIAVRALEKDEP